MMGLRGAQVLVSLAPDVWSYLVAWRCFPVGFLRSDNDAKPLGPNVWCETEIVRKNIVRAVDTRLVLFVIRSSSVVRMPS